MKQSKEYNYAYNTGFYAGHEQARQALEQNQDDGTTFAIAELQLVLSRQEGYLRIGQGRDGLIWARWKWTAGALAGRYTFGSDSSVSVAISQVMLRVHECESGKRKATLDTGYKSRD